MAKVLPISIDRIDLVNWRSFRHACIDFEDLTAIVGPNGAGKSNLVDAFGFVSESLSLGLPIALERRGGLTAVRHRSGGRPRNPSIEITIRLPTPIVKMTKAMLMRPSVDLADLASDLDLPEAEPNEVTYGALTYGIRIAAKSGGDHEVAEETLTARESGDDEVDLLRVRAGHLVAGPPETVVNFDPRLLALPGLPHSGLAFPRHLLASLRWAAMNPDVLREPQEPDEGKTLRPDGANAASVLRSLSSEERDELVGFLAYVVPGINDARAVRRGNRLIIEFSQWAGSDRSTFEALQMSDGTLRILGILLALYQPSAPNVVFVEEPEATVHPAALKALVDLFKARAERQQIIFTTHSADVLDAVPLDAVRLLQAETGYSTVSPVSPHARQVVEDALFTPGELLRIGELAPPETVLRGPQ